MGTEIHWLAVLVAALAGFAIGGIWYGPLFAKAWMAERGITKGDTAGMNMPLIYGTAYLLNLVMAFVLDHTFGTYPQADLNLQLMIAGGIALGFILPAMGVNYLFSRHSLKLFAIDGGYWMVNFLAMGLILHLLSWA